MFVAVGRQALMSQRGAQASAGDRDPFDAVARAQSERMFRTARAMLGNDADARDATQEALLAAWRGRGGLRDADRLEIWLDRIVVNACRMQLRRRARLRESPIEVVDTSGPAPDNGPGTSTESFDVAFSQLSADQRALLVLHHYHGYGVRDIADRMVVPVGTVKWRLFRARRALEAALSEDRDE